MMEKLGSVIPSDAAVLSPNGPFPLPRRTDSGYRLGFSWYFYNPHTDEYLVDMEIGAGFVAHLISQLGLAHLPTALIGFSQGGYLAPFVAEQMPQVNQIIGLSSQYLVEEMQLPVRYRADAVHGAKDEIVSAEVSSEAHRKLLESGAQGEFLLLEEAGHRIDAAMQSAVAELLNRR
jgi:predicted esterase